VFSVIERELPGLIERCREDGREPSVWSVGCSSGEEPYSLAILLSESGVAVDELIATDISEAVLEQARKGRYVGQRLVNIPEEIQQKYFTQEGRWYIVRDRLRQKVLFRRHDILSDPFPQADLILCRNVQIYFSREQQERILSQFAEVLPPGGLLVLGKSETMLGPVRERFRAIDHAERVYARRQA
jgi:chemotaxis protein methyltransferase CheR